MGKLTAASGATVSPGGRMDADDLKRLHAQRGRDSHRLNGAAAHDAVVVSGGKSRSRAISPAPRSATRRRLATRFYLVRNNGAGTTTGTLSGIGDGGKLDIGGKWWRVSFTSTSAARASRLAAAGNDVAIQRIDDPSPSGAALSIVGATKRRWCSFSFRGSIMRRPKPATASIACWPTARWNCARRSQRTRPLSPRPAATTQPHLRGAGVRRGGHARRTHLLRARFKSGTTSRTGTIRCSITFPPKCRTSVNSARGRIASGARDSGARRGGCCAATRRREFPTSPRRLKMRTRRARTRASRCGRAWMPTCAGIIFFRSRSRTATSRSMSARMPTTTARRRTSGSCSRWRPSSRTKCGARA